ncbi:arylsulfotransferase family protein [Nocardia sp. NPDC004168]|uniref:arylsulfotransferase family protein n=1 Tax=Nocardia sp. NPDC004168 TaxID=3154452 RepID=UPI0033B13EEB
MDFVTTTPEELFVFSPASSYPDPAAFVVDRTGAELHRWSSPAEQPGERTDPPSFLRGWNHVEVLPDGGLLAIVPLHGVLRLSNTSEVLWCSSVAAHHDMYVDAEGAVYVLTEHRRRMRVDDKPWAILDNAITMLGPDGVVQRSWSIYEILSTEPVIARMLDEAQRRKHALFLRSGWPAVDSALRAAEVPQALELLGNDDRTYLSRDELAVLRRLPHSPCDVLHANSIELLGSPPHGLWEQGHWLVSLRELDLIAVLDLRAGRVVWWWGPGELSGQHQPSALPSGNILVFDNGRSHGRSRAVEVDPTTGRIVWQYVATPPTSFFTAVAGGCEPLSSGNVLITDAQAGRAFEISRSGDVAWEWTVPDVYCPPRKSRATIYRFAAVPATVLRRPEALVASERGGRA